MKVAVELRPQRRVRWHRAAFLCVFLFALAVPSAGQQSNWATAKLKEIRVEGSQRYPEAHLVAVMGLKTGQEVRREDLQAAADWLAKLGPFQNVQYQFKSYVDGVTVEYQVEDAPMARAYFDNFPWFTDEEINAALKEQVTLFDGAAPQGGTLLDAMTTVLERLLATRGVKAVVEHTVMGEPGGDRMIALFRVMGDTLKIGAVQFEDPLAAESKQVSAAAKEIIGKPFSRFAIDMFLFEQVRPIYWERGHLRAQFGVPKARFTGDPNKPLPDNVLVIVPVTPGPVYRWGGVEWVGNAAFGPAALDLFISLPKGEPANGQSIIAAWERVKDEYARRGYLDVKLDAQPNYDQVEQRVTYRVTLDEGPSYTMGEMVITGLSVRAERIVREAWKIPPGAVFDRIYFDEFLESGVKKAFGDYVVHYTDIGRLLRTNPEKRTVDVLMDFR